MSNGSNNLRVLMPNDDQQVFSDKANYNFAKLLDITGLTNASGNIELLPGTKGDQGIQGIRGNYIYSEGGTDPSFPDISDPVDGDTNMNPDTSIISQYKEGTLPIWEEIIDINDLVNASVGNINIENPLIRMQTETDIITYSQNGVPSIATDTMLLNNFLISDFSTQFNTFRSGILSVYNKNSNTNRYAILIGTVPDAGPSVNTIDEVLKISLRDSGTGLTAITKGIFDLSYIDFNNITSHSGFEFHTNLFDLTPLNRKKISLYVGDGTYINESSGTFVTSINGIGITDTTDYLQIGLSSTNEGVILPGSGVLNIGASIIPMDSGLKNLGSDTNTYKDFYISGDIISADCFIGDRSAEEGINIKGALIGFNTTANPFAPFVFNGNIGFALESAPTIFIEQPPIASSGGPATANGEDLNITASMGSDGSDIAGGKGGSVVIKGANGGDASTSSGGGGNVIIAGGKNGSGGTPATIPYVKIGEFDISDIYKTSNVGIQKDNPETSLFIGGDLGMEIEELATEEPMTTSGNASMYVFPTLSQVGENSIIINDGDKIDGKIFTIKDISGTVSDINFVSINAGGTTIDLGTVEINTAYGFVKFLYYNTTLFVIGHWGTNL